MEETASGLKTGLAAAWYNTIAFLPKLAVFLIILIVGYFFSKLLASLFDKLLERIGFDRVVERGGIKRALARTNYDASDLLSRILFYTVFLFVLQLAFGVFGPNPISDLLTRVISFLPNIFVAIVIVVIAAAIGRAVRDVVGSLLAGVSYGRFLANLASIGIITLGIFAALDQLNIAPAIVNGLFYAMLFIVAGSATIAIGGGGVIPMRAEWDRLLNRMHAEAPRLRSELASAPTRSAEWERRAETTVAEAGTPPPRPLGSHN